MSASTRCSWFGAFKERGLKMASKAQRVSHAARAVFRLALLGLLLAVAVGIADGGQPARGSGGSPLTWEECLHFTRAGKDYWYSAANGGFETFTGIGIEELGCRDCHGPTNANGDPYDDPYLPSCADCHATHGGFQVEQDQCLSCHGRQDTEIDKLGYTDVHRDLGMVCWDCHTDGDLHGDGVEYNSMLEPGAIDADCEDCHDMPTGHSAPHQGKLHCTACHAQTVISCYNCHFESQVEANVKRAKQPVHDFVMLVNREKDGKVYTASFQSLTYQGNAFVAFAPYTGHTITVEGRICTDCHVNYGGNVEAIQQYNDTGQIKFAQWDDDGKVLSWIHGVVPIPEDYEDTLKMDFLTYLGDPNTPPPGDPEDWTGIGKDTWDGHQMFFATPLTRNQMDDLGFATLCPEDVNDDGQVNIDDLFQVLGAWGPCNDCPEDVNDDGQVNIDDIFAVLGAWGPC
ncbi:MAG: hypothetical protein JSV91_14955 [Phycisphaerales bacterium]|nr:MAG: hypothetical protein JSV91_14955 [Phycisphaerales bacterium]